MSTGLKPLGSSDLLKGPSIQRTNASSAVNQVTENAAEGKESTLRPPISFSGKRPVSPEAISKAANEITPAAAAQVLPISDSNETEAVPPPSVKRQVLPMFGEAPSSYLPELPPIEAPDMPDFSDRIVPFSGDAESAPSPTSGSAVPAFKGSPLSKSIPAFETLAPGESPFKPSAPIPQPDMEEAAEMPAEENELQSAESPEPETISLNETGTGWRHRKGSLPSSVPESDPPEASDEDGRNTFADPESNEEADIFQWADSDLSNDDWPETEPESFRNLPEPSVILPEVPTTQKGKKTGLIFLWILLFSLAFAALLTCALYFHWLPGAWEQAVRAFLPWNAGCWPETVISTLKGWFDSIATRINLK